MILLLGIVNFFFFSKNPIVLLLSITGFEFEGIRTEFNIFLWVVEIKKIVLHNTTGSHCEILYTIF